MEKDNKGRFVPGNTGKKKGTQHTDTKKIRDLFGALVENNLPKLQEDLDSMKAVDRVKFVIDLAKFIMPTLKAIDFTDQTPAPKQAIQIVFNKK